MIVKRVNFIEDKENVYLDCYVAEYTTKTRSAMLVIPGGGYGDICSDREGYPIAEAFIPYNFNCFVLNYSVGKNAVFPQPLIEASLAVKYIKEHATELKIDPERVFCVGFSAGGHLAASLATMWNEVDIKPKGINKPLGAILCYPVLTAKEGHAHDGSFKNILGKENLTKADRDKYSIEKKVSKDSAPAFFMTTFDDQIVPMESCLYCGEAYRKAGIPFEMHIYTHGSHGLALANDITGYDCDEIASEWVEKAARWADSL